MIEPGIESPFNIEQIEEERSRLKCELSALETKIDRLTLLSSRAVLCAFVAIIAIAGVFFFRGVAPRFCLFYAITAAIPLIALIVAGTFRNGVASGAILFIAAGSIVLSFSIAILLVAAGFQGLKPEFDFMIPAAPLGAAVLFAIVAYFVLAIVVSMRLQNFGCARYGLSRDLEILDWIDPLDWCDRFLEWVNVYPEAKRYLTTIADQDRFATCVEAECLSRWVKERKRLSDKKTEIAAKEESCRMLRAALESTQNQD